MKSLKTFLTLLAVLAVPSTATASVTPDYAPGQVIVKFRPGLAPAERTDALEDHGADLARKLPVARTVVAGIPASEDVEDAVRELERDPRVASAEPDAYVHAGAIPNDPLFGTQWSMRNTGQTVQGTAGAAGADIHAPEAWERTTGSADVKVAVIDGGINYGQPDLQPNIWRNPGESGGGRETNGVDDDGNGFVDDWHGWDFVQGDNDASDNLGHGTHVSGTLAARGDNGIGVAGVAWKASLIPVRALDNTGGGVCSDTAAGMAYAVQQGARVVNMSLGSHLPCQAERDVIDGAPNVLFVVAALNEGRDVDASPIYPCVYPSPNIVCVAATDSADGLAGFSNYGARSVDLGAPGVSVISSYMKWDGKVSLFTDDLESPLADRWVTGGNPDTWTRTPFVGTRSGAFSLSNSQLGDYAANSDNWARLAKGLDLRGRRDCAASVWLKSSLPGYDPGQPVEAQDRVVAETSPDGNAWDHRPTPLILATSGFERWLIDLSELEGRANGGLRFRLITNGSGPGKGVALDDVEIFCVPPVENYTGAADEFAFDYGTSMAAPHVAGTAVLMLSLDPGLSAAELKARLLASADPVPGLAGKTVSGGRLDAARALQRPPAPPADAPPSSNQPPSGPPQTNQPPVTNGPHPAYGLRIDLENIARTLKRGGLRSALRAGGFSAKRLHLFAPGRISLRVKARSGAVIAAGSCGVDAPSLCSLKAPLTRRGRALLKGTKRVRLTVVLTFTPRGGLALVRRKSVSVRE